MENLAEHLETNLNSFLELSPRTVEKLQVLAHHKIPTKTALKEVLRWASENNVLEIRKDVPILTALAE
jgi:hypothetical protein